MRFKDSSVGFCATIWFRDWIDVQHQFTCASLGWFAEHVFLDRLRLRCVPAVECFFFRAGECVLWKRATREHAIDSIDFQNIESTTLNCAETEEQSSTEECLFCRTRHTSCTEDASKRYWPMRTALYVPRCGTVALFVASNGNDRGYRMRTCRILVLPELPYGESDFINWVRIAIRVGSHGQRCGQNIVCTLRIYRYKRNIFVESVKIERIFWIYEFIIEKTSKNLFLLQRFFDAWF